MSGVHEGSSTVQALGSPDLHGSAESEVEAHGGFDWIPDPPRERTHRPMSSVGKSVKSVLVHFTDGTYIHVAPENGRYLARRNEEGGDGVPGRRKTWLEHEVVWSSADVRPE